MLKKQKFQNKAKAISAELLEVNLKSIKVPKNPKKINK